MNLGIKRIIDEKANRYFFVSDPERLVIEGIPEKEEAKLRLHPDISERGERILPLEGDGDILEAWISGGDMDEMEEGRIIRLKDLLNFEVTSSDPLRGSFESFGLHESLAQVQGPGVRNP